MLDLTRIHLSRLAYKRKFRRSVRVYPSISPLPAAIPLLVLSLSLGERLARLFNCARAQVRRYNWYLLFMNEKLTGDANA